MNSGAFGENFPYSNFHDMNTDWLVKIAKDFLDQYSNIQETITTGLTELNEKAEELKTLKKILKGIDYGNKESNHFEFVEHYGLHTARIVIPKKYNQRILDVISQIANEIEEELETDLSKLEE